MSDRYGVLAHLPKGSADAQYHIVDLASDNHDVVLVVDPNQIYVDPCDVAEEIARAMNTCKVMD